MDDNRIRILCPILDQIIGQDDCMEISFVAEGMFKESTVSPRVETYKILKKSVSTARTTGLIKFNPIRQNTDKLVIEAP